MDDANRKSELRRRMKFMLLCVGIVLGAVFISKGIQKLLVNRYIASQSQVATVATMKTGYSWWQPEIHAVGSTRSTRGVNVTTEIAGMVETIFFTPGTMVQAGDVLVQLRARTDRAALEALQASAELALITYNRDQKQYAINAISKQALDIDLANLKNLNAQVAEQTATLEKKTIRAPFAGRLGISAVNPGQYINPGDKIVTLQTLDPMYVDFYVPQQLLTQLSMNQPVSVTSDSFLKQKFTGKITTIDPAIDISTRNITVEATIENPKLELMPGMFVNIDMNSGQPRRLITVPQTAISFNPYGDIVFIVKQTGQDKKGNPILEANQKFVITGEMRGDQIAVLEGLKEGEIIVVSGQLKLKNGSKVAINNKVLPSNNPSPRVPIEG